MLGQHAAIVSGTAQELVDLDRESALQHAAGALAGLKRWRALLGQIPDARQASVVGRVVSLAPRSRSRPLGPGQRAPRLH